MSWPSVVRHDGDAILILVQGCQVGGQLFRQHGENCGGRVNGSRVARRVGVKRRAFAHQSVHIRDGHQDSNLPTRKRFGNGELVEVARVVVVNGSPKQVAQIADIVRRFGRPAMAANSFCAANGKSGSKPRAIIA
jgi:hypothetical protein